MAQNPQGDSLWNWLGRQVGHVKKAVTTDVTRPKAAAAPRAESDGAKPQASAEPGASPATPNVPQVIYRDEKAEEVAMPDQPGVKLRRTIIDEVIVEDQQRKNEP